MTNDSLVSESFGNTFLHRYDAKMANQIEKKWQQYWEENGTFITPNPPSSESESPASKACPISDPEFSKREPYVVMDMFPYPSGAGLHVGHPLGYIATDVTARFMRMNSRNVLHALGYDAFGLPAEQYAVQTGQHPRVTTEANIANMRTQLKMLGLAHDPSRTFSTIDPEYVRWTQWIFSRIYDAYYDKAQDKACPISELIAKYEQDGVPSADLDDASIDYAADGKSKNVSGLTIAWKSLSDKEQSDVLNAKRLAYISSSPVNWCPGLGTVLANEEVTAEGRSERGNFPVFKRELKQWSMRITAYSDRLVRDLDLIDWPNKVKAMQENWIGKSLGAYINFSVCKSGGCIVAESSLKVYTTRPDTIRGATFMVVAPEHPLVESVSDAQRVAVNEYVEAAKRKSAVERQQDAGKKTGVYLGIEGINTVTGAILPIYVADYVLMDYGTGAIMAVPADDARDEEFATEYGIEIIRDYEKYVSIEAAIKELEAAGDGEGAEMYRLRDWLFSRQRYWGEPFPIVYDEDGVPHLLPDSALPVNLPDVPDYQPKTYAPDDEMSSPEPPLDRNDSWKVVELDLGDGKGGRQFTRETNTMPNWAGSCWYYLRYLNAKWTSENSVHANADSNTTIVDPVLDKYWLGPDHNSSVGKSGGVDLYVGGVEHAVLHLLYARFWHKVLYDLGYVSSVEPFHKLFNQGYIQAYAYTDSRGTYVPADEVQEYESGVFTYNGKPVNREYGKMGKSLKNVVTPDDMAQQFGADTFRIYEMSMGPLDLNRPWETRAVIGAQRYLQRLWRLVVDESTGGVVVNDSVPDDETLRELHKCVDGVSKDFEQMHPNTAISKLIIYANYLTAKFAKNGTMQSVPRQAIEPLVLMTAPVAPHISEELWNKLGHVQTITYENFPKVDPAYLVADNVTIGVQVNGKVRAELVIAASASKDEFESAALNLPRIKELLADKEIRKSIVVPGKIVNFVI